jgi:hypothetical protein
MSAKMKRADWSAWCVGDEVRVQINRPDFAKEFAKVKSARLVGYSVAGNFTKLFHVKETVQWVDAWMKQCLQRANSGAHERKEPR